MRANPLPSEEEERILAEVLAELEFNEATWWLVGVPEPEAPDPYDDDFDEDELPF